MKNIFKITTLLFTLFIGPCVNAQDNSPELDNSLLWEISGNGLGKPSFLYGTMHMMCASDFFIATKTKAALKAADQLVLEVNMSDPQELAAAQNSLMGTELLSKQLNKTELSKLETILGRTTGLKIAQVDTYNLSTVMSLISTKTFSCADLKFYEMDFIETAKKENKEIVGLETVQFQFEMLDKAYPKSAMFDLLEALSKKETAKLVNTYKLENIEEMYKMITDKKVMSDQTKKVILDDRNIQWAKRLPAMMKHKSVFVAVGSAHLAGDQGMIRLLRKAGYTVKSIVK